MKPNQATDSLSMNLSRGERSELIVEAIITLSLIFFIYLSSLLAYRYLIDYRLTMFGLDTTLRHLFQLSNQQIMLSIYFFSVISVVLAAIITNWRVKRRVKQMKLAHVLEYLKFIAQGHYEIRIPTLEMAEMTDVITSINHLVDSTVEAMEEERRIEKSKDELITNIGHDIRTPLTSIIGYLGLIENRQYQSEAELIQYTHIAYTKAQQMQGLVNDLFAYAGSRQTVSELHPHEVQVKLFLEQLAADFELSASEKQIELRVNVQPEDLKVVFDVDKMARVFHNLISNALKYGYGAKFIALSAIIRQDKEHSWLVMEVQNDGELIDESELDAIFQRSYRADRSRNADQPGSGLGLAIVRNIIELHGGNVSATLNNGTTCFVIEIPQ